MHYLLSLSLQQYSSAGWAKCPFNARHEVPVEELDYHMSICEDRVGNTCISFKIYVQLLGMPKQKSAA